MAERIKKATEGDDAANLMAHAVWGAVLAKTQGNSALAGAAGASVGELIAHQLYPDKRTADLTESERQTVSALSTLAGGLAGAITGGNAAGAVTGAGTAQNAVDNNFLNQGRPDAYAARYAGCKGEPVCELTVRKDIAKESAENIDKLKGCWDAGDTACVAKMREQIEIGRNAYTKLKTQDAMVGGGYEQVAEFYADVIDNCGGKCEWLEAALKKTIGDGINMAAYAVFGGGGAPKPSKGVGSTSEIGPKGAGEVASIGGKTCVYNCVVDGMTRYVGITDDIVKRGQAHLREKGITIDRIEGLQNLSRADARAVEQTLIDYHGLGKDGGTLINKINSISSVKNPTKYEQGLIRGAELLKKAGYEGF